MCAIINKITTQAFRTFRYRDKNCYASNFEKLLTLTQGLNATDVGLSPNGDDLLISPYELSAPVCHVNIMESAPFSIGIFIIRKGMELPLHDHPGMTGIVKVLYGTLKITSYKATKGALTLEEHSTLNKIPVTRLPDVTLTSSSDCQVLTPHIGNFHCVQSVGEDTAIFDILSPPYAENRDCHYYREVFLSHKDECFDLEDNIENSCMQSYLIRISQPFDFYCDQLPYKGPNIEIQCEEVET